MTTQTLAYEVRCAWCDVTCGESEAPDSHGICELCKRDVLEGRSDNATGASSTRTGLKEKLIKQGEER